MPRLFLSLTPMRVASVITAIVDRGLERAASMALPSGLLSDTIVPATGAEGAKSTRMGETEERWRECALPNVSGAANLATVRVHGADRAPDASFTRSVLSCRDWLALRDVGHADIPDLAAYSNIQFGARSWKR